MDFLMSDIVRNLSQAEWQEVERQLNQYVEELGESKRKGI
jgi:ATP-dependent RNA circularization protein (DNA/RNA ligase family)